MNYLDKTKARVKNPKDLLDYVYKANSLFRFMNKDGGELLGLKIKQIKPKNKQEWEDYLNKTNIIEKFAKTMKNNVCLAKFRYFNHLIELLTDKDIEDWCRVMVVDYQFKGYQNERIVYDWLEQKGYAVFPSTAKDDLTYGIDLYLVKDRLKGAVSVKSQGWYHNTSQKQKKVLFKQLKDTYITKNLHTMHLIVVLDNGKVNVVRSWPK